MNTENKVKKVRKNAQFRYLEFLKDLKNQIEFNQNIVISTLTDKHKIARGQLKNLNGLNIIKTISPGRYKWIGNMPTLKMANEILKFQRINIHRFERLQETVQRQIDFKTPVIKAIKKPVVKEQNKNYSFSLFWGLIKIQKS